MKTNSPPPCLLIVLKPRPALLIRHRPSEAQHSRASLDHIAARLVVQRGEPVDEKCVRRDEAIQRPLSLI